MERCKNKDNFTDTFMDRISLPQGYKATTREATIYKFQGRPDTRVIDVGICETEPTIEPLHW